MTTGSSNDALDRVVAELRGCRACADDFAGTRTAHAPNPVLQPSAVAALCIASQAPGVRAHHASTPFLDPSGDRLRAWLGLDKTAFYDPSLVAILPMGFCFPGHDAKGGDLPPPKRCAALWRRRLLDARPRFRLVLMIGRAAIDWRTREARGRPLAEIVAAAPEALDRVVAAPSEAEAGEIAVALPHPSWRNNAWLKRHPWFETDVLPRLRRAVAAVTTRPGDARDDERGHDDERGCDDERACDDDA